MKKRDLTYLNFSRLLPLLMFCFCTSLHVFAAGSAETGSNAADDTSVWKRSYEAGTTDAAGLYLGGATIMHLVPHQGKLFAANSYWCDSRNIRYGGSDSKTGWAQILRLDNSDGSWVVDFELGQSYMRPEILKSVTFRTDGAGNTLPKPVNLLLASAFSPSPKRIQISLFTREDTTGKWTQSTVYSGEKKQGERYSVRAMCVHRDKVTGADRIFLTIGTLGVFSGVYDKTVTGKVKWSPESESGTVETRPLAIIEANGDLLFSAGRKIYRRIDGNNPSYQVVGDMSDIYPEVIRDPIGGIRGLTAIPNPNDKGESLIFAMWGEKSRGEIYRLDPKDDGTFVRTREVCLADLMSQYLSGNTVRMVGAAYSDFHAVTNPVTGETLHLIGFESWIDGHRFPTWGGNDTGGFYAGAVAAIRNAKGNYRLKEVNGRVTSSKPPLVAVYCFALSPFETGNVPVIYFGGFDANGKPAHNLAWIFTARLADFLRRDK
jgi:hypothetical protein